MRLISRIALDDQEIFDVIRLESLIVDLVVRAADTTSVTFDEAVRVCVAVFEKADWAWVDGEIERRDSNEPALGLGEVYTKVMSRAKTLSL